jgi:hypothetical protein
VDSFNVKINEESSDFKWVTPEEFESLPHLPNLDEEALEALF